MERIVKEIVPTYAAVQTMVAHLGKKYPFLGVASAGKSVLGRELFSLTFGNGPHRILYAGGTHGTEWLTTLLLLRFLENLLYACHTGGNLCGFSVRSVWEESTLVIIPAVNPDGIELALRGEEAGGHCRDLIRTASNGDLTRWKANARGVDINHNFDAGWALLHEAERAAGILGPSPTRYGGPFPESEPETQALVRLCREVRFRHMLTFHSQGEEIYWEYGNATPEKSLIMAKIFSALSDYTLVKNDGLASHGGFKDWFVDALGAPGFTVEIGNGVNPLPLWQLEPIYERLLPMLMTGLVL